MSDSLVQPSPLTHVADRASGSTSGPDPYCVLCHRRVWKYGAEGATGMSRVVEIENWKAMETHIVVYCPWCGRPAMLDHAVDDNGLMFPSVQCPGDGCGFHDTVRLVGWVPQGPRT